MKPPCGRTSIGAPAAMSVGAWAKPAKAVAMGMWWQAALRRLPDIQPGRLFQRVNGGVARCIVAHRRVSGWKASPLRYCAAIPSRPASTARSSRATPNHPGDEDHANPSSLLVLHCMLRCGNNQDASLYWPSRRRSAGCLERGAPFRSERTNVPTDGTARAVPRPGMTDSTALRCGFIASANDCGGGEKMQPERSAAAASGRARFDARFGTVGQHYPCVIVAQSRV